MSGERCRLQREALLPPAATLRRAFADGRSTRPRTLRAGCAALKSPRPHAAMSRGGLRCFRPRPSSEQRWRCGGTRSARSSTARGRKRILQYSLAQRKRKSGNGPQITVARGGACIFAVASRRYRENNSLSAARPILLTERERERFLLTAKRANAFCMTCSTRLLSFYFRLRRALRTAQRYFPRAPDKRFTRR